MAKVSAGSNRSAALAMITAAAALLQGCSAGPAAEHNVCYNDGQSQVRAQDAVAKSDWMGNWMIMLAVAWMLVGAAIGTCAGFKAGRYYEYWPYSDVDETLRVTRGASEVRPAAREPRTVLTR